MIGVLSVVKGRIYWIIRLAHLQC